jgi:hypothetical protein
MITDLKNKFHIKLHHKPCNNMQKYVIQGIFMCWYRLATEPESGYSSEIKPGIHFFRGSVMLLKGDRGIHTCNEDNIVSIPIPVPLQSAGQTAKD